MNDDLDELADLAFGPLPKRRGWYNMACFNGLSAEQQDRVVNWGNLPFGYEPGGTCPNGAEVEVTTMYDAAPGPRFYCLPCAIEYLGKLKPGEPAEWSAGT